MIELEKNFCGYELQNVLAGQQNGVFPHRPPVQHWTSLVRKVADIVDIAPVRHGHHAHAGLAERRHGLDHRDLQAGGGAGEHLERGLGQARLGHHGGA